MALSLYRAIRVPLLNVVPEEENDLGNLAYDLVRTTLQSQHDRGSFFPKHCHDRLLHRAQDCGREWRAAVKVCVNAIDRLRFPLLFPIHHERTVAPGLGRSRNRNRRGWTLPHIRVDAPPQRAHFLPE